ncbi:MAG: hypothetical protein ACRDUY_10745 [Nitriliruptorales bacterium]
MPRLRGLLVLLAVAATAATALAVVSRWRILAGGAVGFLVLGYALSRAGAPVDGSVPWRSAALVAVIELVLAVDHSYAGHVDRAVVVRDLSLPLLQVGGAWVVAAAVLLVAAAPVGHGMLVIAAGVGAATAIVALLWTLVRSGGDPPPSPRR